MVDGRHTGRLERIEREAEQLGVFEREVMVIGNASGAGFRVKSVGKGIAERVDTTPRPRACLENGDVVTCLRELVRRRQTG